MDENKEKKKGSILKEIILVLVVLIVANVARVYGGEILSNLFSKNDSKGFGSSTTQAKAFSSPQVDNTSSQTKTFSSGGLSIVLPNDFEYYDSSEYGLVGLVQTNDAAVGWNSESYTECWNAGVDPDTISVEDYLALVAQTVGKSQDDFSYHQGLAYYTYISDGFEYCAIAYKGGDAFWILNQWCYEKDFDEYFPKFLEWAHTVSIEGTGNDAAYNGSTVPGEKTSTFSSDGLTITLPSEYAWEEYMSDVGVLFVWSEKCHIAWYRGVPTYMYTTVEQLSMTSDTILMYNGMPYYYEFDDGEAVCYFMVESDDQDSYCLNYYCEESDFQELLPKFIEWSQAVTFTPDIE